MAEEDPRIAQINFLAAHLERVAEQLGPVMEKARRAREALAGDIPGAMRREGVKGSPDAHDQLVAEEMGFARLERARRRLLEVLHDPMDDAPRP
jgi:hypothetical protein